MTILWAWLLAAAAQAGQVAVKQAPSVAPTAQVRAQALPAGLAPSALDHSASGIVSPQQAAEARQAQQDHQALPALDAWAAKTELAGGGAQAEAGLSFLYDQERPEVSEVLRL